VEHLWVQDLATVASNKRGSKGFDGDKHSSLFVLSKSDREKKVLYDVHLVFSRFPSESTYNLPCSIYRIRVNYGFLGSCLLLGNLLRLKRPPATLSRTTFSIMTLSLVTLSITVNKTRHGYLKMFFGN
jgi:hypothetical protein